MYVYINIDIYLYICINMHIYMGVYLAETTRSQVQILKNQVATICAMSYH